MTAAIRIVVAATLYLAALTSVSIAQPSPERIFGPADLSTIAGNGHLTIGINRSGRVTSCRWPSPGYYEQIDYATQSRSEPLLGVEPWHGASWALQFGDHFVWTHDDRWSHQLISSGTNGVIEIESTLQDYDIRMRQQFAVAQEGDVFIARISVIGDLDGPPRAFWYANYSPSTRLSPQVPIALHNRDDFAAFVDPELKAICQFRPRDPSSHSWRFVRRLADGLEDQKNWAAFENGSYIVSGTLNATHAMVVGPDRGETSVADQVRAATFSEQRSATGQNASAMEVELAAHDEGYTATVITAFGANYADAAALFLTARAGDHQIAHESENASTPDVVWVMRRAMATIRTCTDATSGSVVRAPTNTPPLALDWPRYGVWISMAYDAAGDRERARKLLTFYANHARVKPQGDLPPGSLPAALYTNGAEAVPDAIIDAAAAGRVLWAMERHGSQLTQPEMQAFYRDIWDGVNAIADFLVQWREPGGRAPLYTFDYESMRDRRTTELYAASFLGVQSATTIANALSDQRPDWRQASDELRESLRLHALHADGQLRIANPGRLYATGIIPQSDLFDWPAELRSLLREAGGRLDTRTLENVCMLVLSARDIPEPLRNEIADLLRRHLDRETPDAADAAFAYLIAHRLDAIAQSPPPPIEELSPDTP